MLPRARLRPEKVPTCPTPTNRACETGLNADSRNIDLIADRPGELLREAELRDTMDAAGERWVPREFGHARVVEDISQCLESSSHPR